LSSNLILLNRQKKNLILLVDNVLDPGVVWNLFGWWAHLYAVNVDTFCFMISKTGETSFSKKNNTHKTITQVSDKAEPC